jgi:hypothetical protein
LSSLTVKSASEDIIRRPKIAIGRKLPNTFELEMTTIAQ